MRTTGFTATGLLAVGASAQNYLGFNSGATLADRSAKFKADFKSEFETAQALSGAPGKFNAVRLYTNVQAYSKDDPIQAFEAAIETDTKILLGIWASGTDTIAPELSALKKAVDKYGKEFTDLVIGISIGSEDLYRTSVTGVKNEAGVGTGPAEIVSFIGDFKKAFANTPLSSTPVGHVDTWDVWTNGTNQPVIDAVDWVGVDEYPYYENGKGNNIKNSGSLFDRAFDATVAAVGGKPVWVTETGWPATGPAWDQAVASVDNAKYYWDEVGCRKLFNKVPTFWYNLRDSNPENKMKFAITNNLSTKPLFDLTCPTTFDTPTASNTTTSATSSGVSAPSSSATGTSDTGSGSGTGTGTGSGSGSGGSGTTTAASNSPSATSGASAIAFSGLAIIIGVVAALL
ncbi:glycoside hydrolase superfamily [Lasiosphaeris hirsuta]|uniref:Glycoside hydrolase superfamily n=1 Tax=Lasiosphaeris hirsuta TaxID=260670 RepID=A0AA39ZVQ6_9PEZI|nr:glycoside hydrolase superfamily [Lasiosphaeris hirsuta]